MTRKAEAGPRCTTLARDPKGPWRGIAPRAARHALHRGTVAGAMALALGLSGASGTALAFDATDLWALWQEAARSAGGHLTAATRQEGDRLVLDDVSLTTGDMTWRTARVTLIGRGNGGVAVVLPDLFDLVLVTEAPMAPATRATISVAAPDLAIDVLSPAPRAEVTIRGPSLSLALAEIAPAPADHHLDRAQIALADVDFRHLIVEAPNEARIDAALTIGTVHAGLAGAEDDEALELDIDADAIDLVLRATVPADMATDADPRAALDAGLALTGSAAMGPLTAAIRTDGADAVAADATLAAMGARLDLDRTRAHADVFLERLDVFSQEALPDAPPRTGRITLGEYRNSLAADLAPAGRPLPWALSFILRDLAADADAWRIFDPQGLMPNTPFNLVLDLGGTYALADDGAPPIDPEASPLAAFSLVIHEFLATGLGVELAGDGALEFDPTTPDPYLDLPAPAGELHLVARGIYAFIDRLAGIGVISAGQAIAARAALLMFGRAGAQPDELLTDIEFRDGALYLNGLRLR